MVGFVGLETNHSEREREMERDPKGVREMGNKCWGKVIVLIWGFRGRRGD